MIVYNPDLPAMLKAAGLTRYRLTKTGVLAPVQYQNLNAKLKDPLNPAIPMLSLPTLSRLCAALDKQPGDLLRYVPDKEGAK